MTKILLDAKALLSKNVDFFGRQEEVAQFLLSLSNDRGSTTLLSGDRGSGKTSLIDEVKKLQKKQLRSNLFFKYKIPSIWPIPERLRGHLFIPKKIRCQTITVTVPLIPPNTETVMLKGVLLRAIIHALATESRAKRLFLYPITYTFNLSKLRKMVDYKSRSNEKSLALGGSGGGAQVTVGSVYKSELDLSDIKIELVLSSFFRKYASKVRFVIIFDETDKYEPEENVTPDKLILYTKNLFTTNGAHFVFVSTEDYYYRVQGEISSGNRGILYTLFTTTLLINQMSPDDFLNSLRKKISNYKEIRDNIGYRQFEQAMMWSTNLYPFELNKQLTELPEQESFSIELENAEDYYSEFWDSYASMHLLITRIYNNSKKTKDTYYNRYLYKALREVAKFLVQSKSINAVHRGNMVGLIFYNDPFVDEPKRVDFLSKQASRNVQPSTSKITWKNRIYELSASELDRIEMAAEDLVWRLNKMGYIKITRGANWDIPINMEVDLSELSFSWINNYTSINRESTKERNLFSKYHLAYARYRNIQYSSGPKPPDVGAIDIEEKDNKWVMIKAAKGYRFTEDIEVELKEVQTYIESIGNYFIKSLSEWLNASYPSTFASINIIDNTLEIEDKSAKKMIILVNPDPSSVKNALQNKTKVIAIHKYIKTYKNKLKSRYLKKYLINNEYDGFQRSLTDSKKIIQKYFAL